MTKRPDLAVFLYDRHVADLVDAGFGDTAVCYTSEAVADPARSRLSLSLPVRDTLYPATGAAGRWVRSLLPEGRALAWAVQHFGIPEDDRYGLIAALGADVAGAVRILAPPDTSSHQGHYERLSTEEVAEAVRRAPEEGLALNRPRGVRLSLAGMQDKVLLHRIDDAFFLPIDGAPSSLIVKPEPPIRADGLDLTGLATNELYCLTLARKCGLGAAEATVERFGGIPALVVVRFDRVERDGRLERLHQEDLLAAMGLDPLLKYEQALVQRRQPAGGFADAAAVVARPGPTLAEMAALLSDHIGVANLLPFVESVTFNAVIGNADSHARNYSILLPPSGTVALAPLYDLISTRLYEGLDAQTPQRINGRTQIDDVRIDDLVAEATGWGLPPQIVERRVSDTVAAMKTNLEGAASKCVERGGIRAWRPPSRIS
jgi:serine/threonine-protein kinase HipA